MYGLGKATATDILWPMRIIAGKWRGRRIVLPRGAGTRPILDRAKTVLFDMLGHRLDQPGGLPPLAVLDLFAGSGMLGLEALSRGARYCLFVERHPPTAALLRRNLDMLGITNEADVLEADTASAEFPPPPASAGSPAAYRLVFVDPPYRMLAGSAPDRSIRVLLERISADRVIAPDALTIVRHSHQADGGPDLSPLLGLERRDVGAMTFRFMTSGRAAPTVSSEAPPCDGR